MKVAREPIPRDWSLEARDPVIDYRSGEPYEFDELGYVPYTLASTVVCLRQSSKAIPGEITFADIAKDAEGRYGALGGLLEAAGGTFRVSGRWEVLLGQAQVVNYIKTDTPNNLRIMRYPGEHKLPGGRFEEADQTLSVTAKRELTEEFCLTVPAKDIKLQLLSATQTRRIRGHSNLMVNFVALADENPWLAQLDVQAINEELKRREFECEAALHDGSWARTSLQEREKISPEVHALRWVPMREALIMLQRSIGLNEPTTDAWQASEFVRAGVKKRDPMSVTCSTLAAVELNSSLLKPKTLQGEAELEQMIYTASRKFSLSVDPGLRASTSKQSSSSPIGRRRGSKASLEHESRL